MRGTEFHPQFPISLAGAGAAVHRRLPPEISEPDRTYIALAAYNVGYGHIQDARRLALWQNLDPNRWDNLRQVLPLLAKRKYYKKLRYGYARGWEPVTYVQRIRNFHDILERHQNDRLMAVGESP